MLKIKQAERGTFMVCKGKFSEQQLLDLCHCDLCCFVPYYYL